jgi:hypothetical protein
LKLLDIVWEISGNNRPLSEMTTSIKSKQQEISANGKAFNVSADNNMIRYRLPTPAVMLIMVYELVGRQVQVLCNQRQEPGEYSIALPKNLSPGRYLLSCTAGNAKINRVIMMVR